MLVAITLSCILLLFTLWAVTHILPSFLLRRREQRRRRRNNKATTTTTTTVRVELGVVQVPDSGTGNSAPEEQHNDEEEGGGGERASRTNVRNGSGDDVEGPAPLTPPARAVYRRSSHEEVGDGMALVVEGVEMV